MSVIETDPEAVDTATVDPITEHSITDRIDGLVLAADELLRLSTNGRTMFSSNEVLDFALDARVALLEARALLVPITPEMTN